MTRQIPLPLPHQTAMGADDFLITPCNREAAALIEQWPQWPSHGAIVTGASGSGKTHLLNLWLGKSGGKVISVTDLTAQDALALSADTMNIALDDADRITGNAAAEEALFHLYNHLKAAKGSLLLTMKNGAGQAGFALPDLRSRLLTLPVAALHAPDDDLLTALIVKQFRDRQIALDSGVVAWLVPRVARDAASIRTLVDKLDRAALAEGRKISIALARHILESDSHAA